MSSGIGDVSVLQSDARPALEREAGRGHIPALDGLRGAAVLAVMFYHFAMSPAGPSRINDLLVRISRFGWIGVDLFFVLSGFLITGILIQARNAPRYFQNFYARRTVRIFPLYYGVLALFYLVGPHLHVYQPRGVANAQMYQAWFWLYASNFLTAFKGGWVFEQFTHFWSLAVEEHFYLIWPAIVFFTPTRRLGWVCLGFIVGGLLVRLAFEARGFNMYYAHLLTPSRVDSLAMGGLIAVLARREGGLMALVRPARIAAVLCAAAIGLIYLRIHDFQPGYPGAGRQGFPIVRTFGFSILALLFGAVLVLGMTSKSIAARMLRGRWLRFFGKYSYGLYVFHVLMIPWVRKWAGAQAMAGKIGAFPALAAHLAVCLAASMACALISWHLYEKWFLKLKRYF